MDLVDAVLGGLVSIETRRLASYWNGFMDLLFTSSVCLMTCVIDTHVDRSDFFGGRCIDDVSNAVAS